MSGDDIFLEGISGGRGKPDADHGRGGLHRIELRSQMSL